MSSIDLDNEFLETFYGITEATIPENIDLPKMKHQLMMIVDLVKNLKANSRKPFISKTQESDEEEPTGPAILVVDDLGVITYQLKVLLSKFEYDVDCSQEIYDAVSKFKKRKYNYVVMDLFIPTEREGFILLTELKKMAANFGITTVIGVITASPRKEIEQQCKARGADFFLEKSSDWQSTLYNIMNEYISAEKGEDESF